MLLIIPSIDIRGGHCVQMLQSIQGFSHSDDPMEMARFWQHENAKVLHVTDVEGAIEGRLVNVDCIRKMVSGVHIPIGLGGGLRSSDEVKQAFDLGVYRVLIGTMFIEKPDEAKRVLDTYGPSKVVLGIDALDGIVTTQGRTRSAGLTALTVALNAKALGFKRVVFNDNHVDGTLGGVSLSVLRELAEKTCMQITYAGRISGLAELLKVQELEKFGVDSVMIGRELYENRFPCQLLWRLCEKDNLPYTSIVNEEPFGRSATARDYTSMAKEHRPSEVEMEVRAPVGREGRGSFYRTDNVDRDSVDCTVYSPPRVHPGDHMFVQVYAHIPGDTEAARALAQEFDSESERRGFTSLGTEILRGSVLTFDLRISGLTIEDAIQQVTWRGRTDYVQFDVLIPLDHPPGSIVGKVSVSQDAVPIGFIRFKIKVIEGSGSSIGQHEVCGESKRYKMAFISYASSDRSEVLKRVQMLPAVGISYFQDVLGLDPGARWALQLYRHIDESDVLFLFWSSAAKASEWVTKEWKYGLSKKGDEFIYPVVIEGPPPPSPPPELARIQFSDKMLYFM